MRWEYLYGDRALQAGIASAVDFAHAARTKGGLDLVRPEFCAGGKGHERVPL